MNRKEIIIGMIDIGEDTPIRKAFRQKYIDCLKREHVTICMIPQFEKIQPKPVVSIYMEYYANKCNGILLPGGGDIDPKYWGDKMYSWSGQISPVRDQMELVLAKKVIGKRKPLLGICRGVQVMNVADGGSLYQDIEMETGIEESIHSNTKDKDKSAHTIAINKESKLYSIVKKETMGVNSMHHQSIKKLGCHYTATAKSYDGIIEAIERNDYPFALGVQWHPEHMAHKYKEQQHIFTKFVEACTKHI